MNYLYDGTFEGFLTCVYEHYYTEKAHNISPQADFQETLLTKSRIIETDPQKSDRVYDAVICKISRKDLLRVYKTLGSIVEDREMKCLRYLRLGFKIGHQIQLLHGNPIVHAVEDANRKVGLEINRMIELIRFNVVRSTGSVQDPQNAEEILYATIEPDNDVLEFLIYHFKDRYKNDPFIIHDKKRDKAIVYGRGEWYVTEFTDAKNLLSYTDNEIQYQQLWKMYFDTIAIKERINPKCQKNFMPVRYWKNLTEIDVHNAL